MLKRELMVKESEARIVVINAAVSAAATTATQEKRLVEGNNIIDEVRAERVLLSVLPACSRKRLYKSSTTNSK